MADIRGPLSGKQNTQNDPLYGPAIKEYMAIINSLRVRDFNLKLDVEMGYLPADVADSRKKEIAELRKELTDHFSNKINGKEFNQSSADDFFAKIAASRDKLNNIVSPNHLMIEAVKLKDDLDAVKPTINDEKSEHHDILSKHIKILPDLEKQLNEAIEQFKTNPKAVNFDVLREQIKEGRQLITSFNSLIEANIEINKLKPEVTMLINTLESKRIMLQGAQINTQRVKGEDAVSYSDIHQAISSYVEAIQKADKKLRSSLSHQKSPDLNELKVGINSGKTLINELNTWELKQKNILKKVHFNLKETRPRFSLGSDKKIEPSHDEKHPSTRSTIKRHGK